MSAGLFAAGASALFTFTSMIGQREAAKQERMLAGVNADAQNLVRKSGNELRAAQGALSNFTRSVRNSAQLRAAGDAVGTLSENLGRALDSMTQGDLSRRLRAAETLGAAEAAASAAGVGGSTVDVINATTRLNFAITDQNIKKNQGYATYDLLKQRAGIMPNAAQALDMSVDVATVDYTRNVPQYVAVPSWSQIALATAASAANAYQPAGGAPASQSSGYTFFSLGSSSLGLDASAASRGFTQ